MTFLRRHLEVSVFSRLAATLADGEWSMNTRLSGSAWVDDIKSHPQGELRGLTKLIKITEDVRKYAAQKGIDESVAIGEGLREKAEEFRNAGAEIYSKP